MQFAFEDPFGLIEPWLGSNPGFAESFAAWKVEFEQPSTPTMASGPYLLDRNWVKASMVDCAIIEFFLSQPDGTPAWVFLVALDSAGFGELLTIREAEPADKFDGPRQS